jgi:hypothetical protein
LVLYTLPCWAFANELLEMFRGATATLSVRDSDCTAVCGVGMVESVTLTAKLKVPDVVGVPEIVPLDTPSAKPAGSAPEAILHEYGVVPPAAAKVAVKAVPCCPLGKEVVVIITGATAGWFTTNVAGWLATLPALLRARTLNCEPLSESEVDVMAYVEEVALLIATPFFIHWYANGLDPVAATVKYAGWLAFTVSLAGCEVITGTTIAAFTVNDAALLVVDPKLLLTVTVN